MIYYRLLISCLFDIKTFRYFYKNLLSLTTYTIYKIKSSYYYLMQASSITSNKSRYKLFGLHLYIMECKFNVKCCKDN